MSPCILRYVSIITDTETLFDSARSHFATIHNPISKYHVPLVTGTNIKPDYSLAHRPLDALKQ